MRTPTHRQFVLLGLGLIALVNAIALGGVAWNRGAADARLVLSERELHAPYAYGFEREDSEVSLAFDWRVALLDSDLSELDHTMAWLGDYYGQSPGWLDASLLRSLGFDTTPPREGAPRRDRQLQRQAWLVLELDGDARRRQLEFLARRAAAASAKSRASGDERDRDAATEAAETLERIRSGGTRLFVVDAGPDRALLRARYPDRAHYAVVEGLISMSWTLDDKKRWHPRGQVDSLRIGQVHVPREQARRLAAALPNPPRDASTPRPFTAVVAWGRRAEPWVESSRLR